MKPAGGLLLFLALPLLGWGTQGHRLAAEGSLRTLPPELRTWFLGREAELLRASLEPDLWKETDPAEVHRHRIFCEAYGGATKVPRQASVARGQVGVWAFEASGQLPWVIEERYRKLVEAFRKGEPRAVAAASGWLCHYIADAQVPLHTTQNRNGKQTAQKGVHQRWETGLLEGRTLELGELRPASPPADLPGAIATWISGSHALVLPLLSADRAASQGAARGAGTRGELFWTDQRGTVVQQLRRSAESTGDLLLAAWIEAGQPLLP